MEIICEVDIDKDTNTLPKFVKRAQAPGFAWAEAIKHIRTYKECGYTVLHVRTYKYGEKKHIQITMN
jgi:hypothetical protein